MNIKSLVDARRWRPLRGCVTVALAALGELAACAQGLPRLYDQAVAYGLPVPGDWNSDSWPVRTNMPYGQSFVPRLPAVGFAELALRYNTRYLSNKTETLVVLLREGSAAGRVLGSSLDAHFSFQNQDAPFVQEFLFPESLGVVPGQTYFLEVVHRSGDDLIEVTQVAPGRVGQPTYYELGEMTKRGRAFAGVDLWFREGVVVPEPGTPTLLVLGGGALALGLWRRRRHNQREPGLLPSRDPHPPTR